MTKPHISLRSSFVASASGSLTDKSILSRTRFYRLASWVQRWDSNPRSSGNEPDKEPLLYSAIYFFLNFMYILYTNFKKISNFGGPHAWNRTKTDSATNCRATFTPRWGYFNGAPARTRTENRLITNQLR